MFNLRKKEEQSAKAARLAALMATKPGEQVEVWTKKELEKLPDGEYDVIASTTQIDIRGTRIRYDETFPMCLRRLS